MAFQKKVYRSHNRDGRTSQPRGGVEGKTVDSSFGAEGNNRTSPHKYPTQSVETVASPTWQKARASKKVKV